MTLKKLSEITGYSVSTLSKIFSDSNEISKKAKLEVIKKAKELGCYEKYCKTVSKNKVVAVLIPEIDSAFYNTFVSKIKTYCEKKNATVLVSVTNFSIKTEEELISFYSTQKRADGIIVLEGLSKAKKYSNVPVVYMANNEKERHTDVVSVNYGTGIEEAILDLKNNGHKKIAYIGESLTLVKLQKFKSAMQKYNLPLCEELMVTSKDRFEKAGFTGMKKFYKTNNMPTAVLCAYDYIALGAIDFLSSKNLKVPNDVSIIGMDDIKLASHKNISLSSIAIGVEETCKLLTDFLFDKIENPYVSLNKTVTVNSKYIPRKSVKKIN